jgi:Ran GTPase-activating protein (RanGAP) involved in mRNA processing and transport
MSAADQPADAVAAPIEATAPAAEETQSQASAAASAASSATPKPMKKAALGAKLAAEAAAVADRLLQDTRSTVVAASLQDLKLPCVAVSTGGSAIEKRRTIAADFVIPSPWCAVPHKPGTTLPQTDAEAVRLEQLAGVGLANLSLGGRPLSFEDAQRVAALLAPNGQPIAYVDAHRALDDATIPPLPAEQLAAHIASITADVGPEESANEENPQENVEKLQASLEKFKQDYTSYDDAIKFLAAKRLDRTATLFKALTASYTVTVLDLSQNRLGAANTDSGRSFYQTLRRLGTLIDDTSKLAVLDLSGNLMGPVGIGIVAKAMCKNITIHTLNLSGNELCVEAPDEDDDPENEEGDPVFGELTSGLEALSEMIKKNKFLRTLSIRNNRIKGEIEVDGDDDGADTMLGKFLEPFRKYHRLETLDMSGNELGAGGMKMVMQALAANKGVRALDVSDNEIGLAGLAQAAVLLGQNNTIEKLMLQRNGIAVKKGKRALRVASETFSAFAAALSANTGLRELDLSGHHVGVDMCDLWLADFAKSCVTTLHFESNHLCGEPDVAEPDTRALQKLLDATRREGAPLKEVHLGSNQLMAAGAKLVAEHLSPGVEVLGIARNAIGNEGAASIAAAVLDADAPTKLASVDLGFNGITDAAVFADVFAKSALQSVNLASNHLAADGAAFEAMVQSIGRGGALQKVVLASNQIGTNATDVTALTTLFSRAAAPLGAVDLMNNPAVTLQHTLGLLAALRGNAAIHTVALSSQAGDRTAVGEAAIALLEVNKRLVDLNLCFAVDADEEHLQVIRDRLLHNSLTAGVQQ